MSEHGAKRGPHIRDTCFVLRRARVRAEIHDRRLAAAAARFRGVTAGLRLGPWVNDPDDTERHGLHVRHMRSARRNALLRPVLFLHSPGARVTPLEDARALRPRVCADCPTAIPAARRPALLAVSQSCRS